VQAWLLAEEQGQEVPFRTNVAALCHNIGVAYERAHAPGRAIIVYHRALKVNPNPAASRQRLAIAFRQLAENLTARGDQSTAAAALDSAQKYDP